MIALFFDTETTGIKSWKNPDFKPALVQLGCILQDLATGRVLGELNLIANQYPGSQIPVEASNVHGISDEMANRFGIDPNLIDLAFSNLIEKADVIVAHNIDYDMDVITDNMPLSLAAVKGKTEFCTMRGNVYVIKAPMSEKQKHYFTSRGKLPDFPYKVPNLTETYMHYFGEKFEGAHDAMADIRACRDVLLSSIEAGWYEIANDTIVPTEKLTNLMVAENK